MNFGTRYLFSSASAMAVGLVKRRGSLDTVPPITCNPIIQKRSIHFELSRRAPISQNKFDIFKPTASTLGENWFGEYHSLSEIHKFMAKLATIPNVYNVVLGHRSSNPIKGLKVYSPLIRGRSARDHRQVILMGGHSAHEWTGVAMSLYLASALSKTPILGTDVVIIPTVNPTQYELFHRSSDLFSSFSPLTAFDFAQAGCKIPVHQIQSAEVDVLASPGPIKSYIDRQARQFIRVVQDLESSNTTLLDSRSSSSSVESFSPFTNCVALGAMGETVFIKKQPNYIIELRDKNKTLEADQIVQKGEDILSRLKQLVSTV